MIHYQGIKLTSGQFKNPSLTSSSPSELIYLFNPSFCLRNLGKNPFAPLNPLKRQKYVEDPLFRLILSLELCAILYKNTLKKPFSRLIQSFNALRDFIKKNIGKPYKFVNISKGPAG